MAGFELIRPDWPAPSRVRAVATTRTGGASTGPYASLNLGDHVGDDPDAVATNRRQLARALGLPAAPFWLRQVHGTAVVRAGDGADEPHADASIASAPGAVCAVLTADCLPVLFCDEEGRHVAAAHAGWRGLAAGVLEATVAALGASGAAPQALLAWIGPAIGPAAYEVGDDVRSALVAAHPQSGVHFAANPRGRWQGDLAGLARDRLASAGVTRVSGGTLCTHADAARFFSHRRDGTSGRQATLIWLEQ